MPDIPTPAGAPGPAAPGGPSLPPALEESIKKTIDLLSRIIKKPPLNAKLLSKPPFRYLHDILSEVIRASDETSGFCRGLYDENEKNSEFVKEKDAKVAYLYKMIDCIGMITNVDIKANPLKIVAGMDPEDTNAFLQLMAKVVLKKADTSAAVKRVLAGEHFTKKGAAPAAAAAPPKEQQPPPQQQQRERAPSALKNNAKSREAPSKSDSRENVSQSSTNKGAAVGGGDNKSHNNRSNDSVVQDSERERGKDRDRGDRGSDKERDRGDRERDRDDEDTPSRAPPHPLEPSSSSSDVGEDSERKTTSLVPTPAVKRRERPTTARAPPPKVKGADFAAVEETSIAPSIIQEGAQNGSSDSEDEGYIILGTEEEERAKREALKDQSDGGSGSSRGGSEDELHGGLVRKILDTKDKHHGREEEDKRERGGEREEKPKDKSVAKKEIEGLRESIQTLCRSTNPLAKTMDYMQEDVDSMNKEMEFWRRESKKYSMALDEASKDTYEALMPLDLKLKQIDASIEDMEDKISNQKAGIIQAFAALKMKAAHVSNAGFLSSLVRSDASRGSAATTPPTTTPTTTTTTAVSSEGEAALLGQRLLVQELDFAARIKALEDALAASQSGATAAPSSSQKKPTAKQNASSSPFSLRFSKHLQTKAERACAQLRIKLKNDVILKDIEFIELTRVLADACKASVFNETQSRNVMETVERILSFIVSKLRTAIARADSSPAITTTADAAFTFGFSKSDTECFKLVLILQDVCRRCFGLLETNVIHGQETRADFAILILRNMTHILDLVPLISHQSEKSAIAPSLNSFITPAASTAPKLPTNPNALSASSNAATPQPPPTQQLPTNSLHPASAPPQIFQKEPVTKDLRQEVCKVVSQAGSLHPCLSHIAVFCLLKKCLRVMNTNSTSGGGESGAAMTTETRNRLMEEDLCYYLYAVEEAVKVASNGIGKRLNSRSVLDERNDVELVDAIGALAKSILSCSMDKNNAYSAELAFRVSVSVGGGIEELVRCEGVWRESVKSQSSMGSMMEDVVYESLMG
ncbi:TRAF3-interacting protein 1 [Podochytrium sp. JEL0797]|nr:TRAF3-interacting protein 1 [Podochytrium sp. JEL0797]